MYELRPIVLAVLLARAKFGLTQEELAKKAGLTQSMLSNWERGISEPSLISLEKVAKALDCELKLVPKNSSH